MGHGQEGKPLGIASIVAGLIAFIQASDRFLKPAGAVQRGSEDSERIAAFFAISSRTEGGIGLRSEPGEPEQTMCDEPSPSFSRNGMSNGTQEWSTRSRTEGGSGSAAKRRGRMGADPAARGPEANPKGASVSPERSAH
jgi:hypothetical protein